MERQDKRSKSSFSITDYVFPLQITGITQLIRILFHSWIPIEYIYWYLQDAFWRRLREAKGNLLWSVYLRTLEYLCQLTGTIYQMQLSQKEKGIYFIFKEAIANPLQVDSASKIENDAEVISRRMKLSNEPFLSSDIFC